MDLIVYDKQFNPLKLVDTYDSLIWTERLYSPGDFELVVRPSTEAFQLFAEGNYVWNREAKETYPEYTLLEYIEATRTQWIDTGYAPNTSDKMDNVEFGAVYSQNNDGLAKCFIGTMENASQGYIYAQQEIIQGNSGVIRCFIGNENTFTDRGGLKTGLTEYNETVYKYDGGTAYFYINGTQYTQGRSTGYWLCNTNIALFASGNGGYASAGRMKSAYIKEHGEYVRNFIPAIRNIDGAVGMYDQVTREFFSSKGNNQFVPGPPVGSLGPDHILRKLMIIEKNELQTDPENGNQLIVSGRSLESILDRRIVWKQTEINSAFQTAVQRLLNENAINPSNVKRKIPKLKFVSSSDPQITALTLEAQYTGDNLLEVLTSICGENKIGYRIEVDDNNDLVFQLYAGIDHSYNQTVNPYISFRPEFDNLLNTNYKHDLLKYKNITNIGGEGEGNARTFATYYIGDTEPEGIERREHFTDARDLSTKSYNEAGQQITLTPAEYQANLQQRGSEKLEECKETREFEAEIETIQQYHFKEDFNMGDYVQITNEYGIEGKALITEVVRSVDETGQKTYPAFVLVDWEDE